MKKQNDLVLQTSLAVSEAANARCKCGHLELEHEIGDCDHVCKFTGCNCWSFTTAATATPTPTPALTLVPSPISTRKTRIKRRNY